MQLPQVQPTPTRWPTLTPFAFGPTAVTRPMTSWPRTAGYCEMPQSFAKTDRSEWHKPLFSTTTSTSSVPSAPRSTLSSTIGCFAAFAIQAILRLILNSLQSVELVVLPYSKRQQRRGDAVHRGAAIMEGRKYRRHALREAKRRLRQRVEPGKLRGREFDCEG